MADVRTYEIVTTEGKLRMDIPEDWKVTFGPISIGAKNNYSGGSNLALRVYESDTKQRAIFTNVLSFRDLSIPVMREYIQLKGSDSWESDNNGSRRNSSEIINRKWEKDNE